MANKTESASASAVRAARAIVVTVGRLRRRIRGVNDAADITSSQASVLARLSKNGPTTASVLAAAERVRPQSMAATVAALSRLGLVERHPDPEDGRKQRVTLTAPGRERAEGDREARHAWLTRALEERCTEDERRTVVAAMAVLEKLIDDEVDHE
ncbi:MULTISPECIES: MarR family transcriptional regulator [unclassified Streptomyces]|uniref:MarR family winged helix-turn-helix transcriptional regulator n=1 Tax=unclassified Streptomyces TaxID=2593676 RepID=UPI002E76B169|nr:MarR family transcriptional regulator [Streptomyces sp. JV190]MEE1839396.1 MarR family transcriptional regulator [Streptomyces sp. JV190]